MLTSEHIKVLRLDNRRVEAHARLPPPVYSMRVITDQLAAVSDAVVSSLLNLDMESFTAQLPNARRYSVSCLVNAKDGRKIGVSAATSMIKSGPVISKHLILPHPELRSNNGLDKHFVIGVFIRSIAMDNYLPVISKVEIAGWLDTDKLDELRAENTPQTFKSKLSVVMVPCSKLNPIATLDHEIVKCVEGCGLKQPLAEGD